MAKTEAIEQQVESDVKVVAKDIAVNDKALSKERDPKNVAKAGGSVSSDRVEEEKSIRR